MGEYLIPNVQEENLDQIIHHAKSQNGNVDQVWDWSIEGAGVLFIDPTRTDEECAAVYAGFVLDPDWQPPLPSEIAEHIPHLREFFNADPATIDTAEIKHVIKDVIRALRYLNSRLS